ncbi:MAG TPA: SAM-dependent methyltransferase [Rhizomicrobium sp.]|nr:SAM-dependent methyltransferase [Rhizomicrobium sp.]
MQRGLPAHDEKALALGGEQEHVASEDKADDPMNNTITLKPIGFVRGGRAEPIDDDWDSVQATIELDAAQFKADATASLDAFSHIEVVFHFNQVPDGEINTGARHPRGRKDWPLVGIFAQRGKGRPNRIGVTVCKLVAVDGLSLTVRGLDAIAGTPVLDIKPVMTGFLPRGEVREPEWARELMAGYW